MFAGESDDVEVNDCQLMTVVLMICAPSASREHGLVSAETSVSAQSTTTTTNNITDRRGAIFWSAYKLHDMYTNHAKVPNKNTF
jgi:hypothetical protein